jgi:hypothetical protein
VALYQVPFNFYNQVSGGATPMPRPKSELTKNGKTIGVRLTPSEYAEYERLGKSKWLRQLLSKSIQERKNV